MALKVRYSLRAQIERRALIEDIAARFGDTKAKEVSMKVDRVIGNIAEMPWLFRASKRKKGLRKCVLSKQTSIYYRVNGERLEIISFRPNKIDPGSYEV